MPVGRNGNRHFSRAAEHRARGSFKRHICVGGIIDRNSGRCLGKDRRRKAHCSGGSNDFLVEFHIYACLKKSADLKKHLQFAGPGAGVQVSLYPQGTDDWSGEKPEGDLLSAPQNCRDPALKGSSSEAAPQRNTLRTGSSCPRCSGSPPDSRSRSRA